MTRRPDTALRPVADYVTVMVDGQLFGLPIGRVQDVFVPERLTRIPLAPAEVAGILNLRGRIVTAIDMRARLGMQRRGEGCAALAVGVECRGESYGLLVDAVAEVMNLEDAACEPMPANLDARLARVASGVFRLDGRILVVLDVDRVLDTANEAAAA
jgi:purine-binding chemotaxis protein CheW